MIEEANDQVSRVNPLKTIFTWACWSNTSQRRTFVTILSDDDMAFWSQNGYVVIHDAVPAENLTAVVDEVWAFLGMDRNDPDDWYREPMRNGGMVEMYQSQGLWNNRQHPRVHQAFAEILGREDLWVSMDRANCKPPMRPDKPDWGHDGMIHWDVDTSKRPIPFGVQGVLYLEDTQQEQGTFQCVPGLHRSFEDWVRTQPAERNPRQPDLTDLEVKKIPGRAGDLLIWQRLLAHGNSPNTAGKPRLAQYITMSPANYGSESARESRIKLWQDRLNPSGKAFPGDKRRWEQQNKAAELTNLGRKLLGQDPW